MSILGRLFKVGQANANKAVDKLEKPEVMLEQAIRDQEKMLREAKESVMNVIATERQTKALVDKEVQNKELWESKAEAALKQGKEDLAAKALTRSEEHEQKAESLRPQWEGQRVEVENLKAGIRKMEEELSDLKRNKDIIIAQAKTADVKKQIYNAKAKIGNSRTTDLIERMKNKAERSSFEASAAQEMAEDTGGDSLEKEFENLGSTGTSESVNSKLEAMKAKLKG